MNKVIVLAVLICLTVMITMCHADCCIGPYYPFGGCKGECNAFCCNCENGCGNENPMYSNTNENTPAKIFAKIDKNNDKIVNFDEALEYNVKNGGEKVKLQKDQKWFTSIDKNGDGKIQPNEFDKTL